jgi:glycosyltransferase involved in cell wall biosynthesis
MAKVYETPVSVILPTYNRAHLISRAIKSVLDQTYQNLELIVVDDGSTDDTKYVVKSVDDERIKYVKHEQNKGANAARNTGIRTAKNDYIAFQDSDDQWFPEKLEKQMKIFDRLSPKVGVVYTGYWRIRNNTKEYSPFSVAQKDGNLSRVLLGKNCVPTSTSVVRKACFEKIGVFDEQLPRLQEWELWIRISKHYDFKCVDEPLVNAYECADSLTKNEKAHILARELILRKHFEDIAKETRLLGRHYYEIGNLLSLDGRTSRGRHYLKRAATTYPFHIKSLWSAFILFSSPTLYAKAARLYLRLVRAYE